MLSASPSVQDGVDGDALDDRPLVVDLDGTWIRVDASAGAAGLMTAGLALACWFGALGAAFAAAYLALTFGYSLYFKRRLALDVFVLASLYVIRVVAGGAALRIPLSNWLLGFCGFFFLSL